MLHSLEQFWELIWLLIKFAGPLLGVVILIGVVMLWGADAWDRLWGPPHNDRWLQYVTAAAGASAERLATHATLHEIRLIWAMCDARETAVRTRDPADHARYDAAMAALVQILLETAPAREALPAAAAIPADGAATLSALDPVTT